MTLIRMFIWNNLLSMMLRGENMVCKLEKAIYGKQNSLAWFEKFSRAVSKCDFQQCHSDHSIFIRHSSANFVILAVYIDNILLTKSNTDGIEKAKAYLNTFCDQRHRKTPILP